MYDYYVIAMMFIIGYSSFSRPYVGVVVPCPVKDGNLLFVRV